MARGNRRPDGLVLLGEVFAKQGLFGEALERYREALALDRDLYAARFGEAWSLVRLGRPGRSAADGGAPDRRTTRRRRSADAARHGVRRLRRPRPPRCRRSRRRAASRRCARRFIKRSATSRDRLATTKARSPRIGTRWSSTTISPSFAFSSRCCSRRRGSRAKRSRSSSQRSMPCQRTPKRRSSWRRCDARSNRPAEALALLIELLQRDPYHFDALHRAG